MSDLINGLFELLGAVFISVSIVKLHREKHVAGVSWLHAGFFLAWGYWNLYYYPSLGQWLSTVGSASIVIANTIWFSQLVTYTRNPGNGSRNAENDSLEVQPR